MFPRVILTAAAIGLAVSAQRFDAGPAWNLAATGAVHHRFVTPGSPFEVSVELRDAAGSPVPAASIVFVLPETGFGAFSGEGEWPWLRRVPVSETGSATAALTAPDQEAFYTVSAVAEGTTQEVTFAITVLRELPAPGWEASEARAAAAERFGATVDSAGLFGPYWLPGGGRFGPAAGSVTSTPATAGSYFFWYDPSPRADFFHPVRFLAVPGSEKPAAMPAPVTAHWWPELQTADGNSRSRLLRALADGSIRTHPADFPAPTEFQISRTAPVAKSPLFGEPAPTGACSIIAYGPGRQFAINKETMTGVFNDTLQIPPDRQLGTSGATQADQLRQMFDRLVDLSCTKLYLYMAGHGDGAAIQWADPSNPDKGVNDSYAAIASHLEGVSAKLKAKGIALKVCVVIQSCGSGGAVSVFQGHGFDGEILTSSDREQLSYSYPVYYGSFFTAGLADCWNSSGSDRNGDGATSFDELLQCTIFPGPSVSGLLFPPLEVWRQTYIRDSFPQSSRIYGAGLTIQPHSVTLIQGASQPVAVPRPEWAAGDIEVRIEAASPSIANINGQGFVTLTVPQGEPIRFTVNGVAAGQSDYNVRITKDAQGKTGAGTARITVTAPVSLGPATGTGSTLSIGNLGVAIARISRNPPFNAPQTFRLSTAGGTAGPGDVAFTPFEVTIPAGASSANFNVFGLRPGRINVFASSGSDRWTMPVLVPGTALPGPLFLNSGTSADVEVCEFSETPPVSGSWLVRIADGRAVLVPDGGTIRDPLFVNLCARLGTTSVTARERSGLLAEAIVTAPNSIQNRSYAGFIALSPIGDGPIAGLGVSALPTFNEWGSRFGFDIAAVNSAGAFVRNTTFNVSADNADLFLDGSLLARDGASVRVNAFAFARMEYAARQAGPASIRIATGSGQPVVLNFTAANRLAEPADSVNLLNRPEPLVVGQAGGIDFEIRRNGAALNNAVITCQLDGDAFDFTSGSRFRNNRGTQFTGGSTGRVRIPITTNRAGFGLLTCYTGQVKKEVAIRTVFPGQ